MKRSLIPLTFIAIGVILLSVAGCASAPSRFYVLSPAAESMQTATGPGREIAVGIGPVTLPEYLDRPQIVTRTSRNELRLAEFDRWAEPLRDNFTQVLRENLAALLPSQRVVAYPWKRATPIDYQITVTVTRFEWVAGGDSVLSVRWSLLAGDGRQEFLTRASTYDIHPAGEDYPAIVAAMNDALAAFSHDIVAALRELPRSLR
jgi:uncharacterized lipoprotein YmbA